MDKNLTIGKITLTDEEVKAKYGEGISKIQVFVSEEDTAVAYLKRPTRAHVSVYTAKVGHDPIMANEILMRNTIIKEISDMRVLDDDVIFYSACNSLEGIMALKKSSLTKL